MGVPYAEVIGDPIAHSKSPLIHKYWLQKLGVEGDFRAVRLAPDDLGGYFTERRRDPAWRGCSVTMPLKLLVTDRVERETAQAEAAGAINCVTPTQNGLVGTNTDIAGIVSTLPSTVSAQKACILGSGGAARAALAALVGHSFSEIRLVSRSPDRAAASLAAVARRTHFYATAEAAQAMAGADIVINATPLGMAGKPAMGRGLLDALAFASPDAVVLDLVYAPPQTVFLRKAASLGQHPIDGLCVLLGQAREAFRLFFGASPPIYDPHLTELLTA